ncbi:hypothetical protein [Rhizobium viscosum]|uniref:AraC-like DNA-binding protein n=1 Tax=Rhizobium viscosum TaxID=1673 RepID=A0ABR9IT63_RHIVS|nr:hypothetical protein [Rhizobium viscosum]MBE1506390.1 AraC-like DNA-binding protein [Rhizobium viscosum]
MRAATDAAEALTVEAIVENRLYGLALKDAALKLIAMHDAAPRIVRYTADMKRWLLTQSILAFHFQRVTSPSHPGLTAANLKALIADSGIASKNTAFAHLAEMRNYGLLVDVHERADKRVRPLRISETAETLIREWFDEHLKSLDTLDGGTRSLRSSADRRLLWYAQPRMSESLFHDPNWASPSQSVDTFVRTASGSNILHDLMSRLPPEKELETRMSIGPLRIGEFSRRYAISRTHARRLFERAQVLEICGWDASGDRGDFWLAAELIRDYRHWQAVKFAAIDEAFEWACSHVPEPTNEQREG